MLGRDAVASIHRWGRIDSFCQALLAATDELSAPTDKTIRFRLKRPFPLLPAALAKFATFCPVIMPARLAEGEPGKPITEMTGSGPFRFLMNERVPGSCHVCMALFGSTDSSSPARSRRARGRWTGLRWC